MKSVVSCLLLVLSTTAHADTIYIFTLGQSDQDLSVHGVDEAVRRGYEIKWVYLDAVQQIEARLSAGLSKDTKVEDARRLLQQRLSPEDLSTLATAWHDKLHAGELGLNVSMLPAVYLQGRLYPNVNDISGLIRH